jgi:hypothetical protein
LQGVDGQRSFQEQKTVYEDITTELLTGDQIQLDSYKSIPEFSGDIGQYRSWRNQVTRRMWMIEKFQKHPKYEAALGIIRSKITGPASDILTNNKTAYNILAIIERLDETYADQRPLYIVEAEMTSIKQGNKTLQEYYDSINQALNLVISKIVLTYKVADEQKSLVREAQLKAIRTFILGLKNQAMRNILYGRKSNSLAETFTIARTVNYDGQYLQLEQCEKPSGRSHMQNQQGFQRKYYSNPQQQSSPKFNVTMSCNPQKATQLNKTEPMEIDNSKQFKQTTNWKPNYNWHQKNNDAQKRGYDSSRQQAQQPYKMQRINNFQDEQPHDVCENDDCDIIPEDQLSVSSEANAGSSVASVFLEE